MIEDINKQIVITLVVLKTIEDVINSPNFFPRLVFRAHSRLQIYLQTKNYNFVHTYLNKLLSGISEKFPQLANREFFSMMLCEICQDHVDDFFQFIKNNGDESDDPEIYGYVWRDIVESLNKYDIDECFDLVQVDGEELGVISEKGLDAISEVWDVCSGIKMRDIKRVVEEFKRSQNN